MRTISEQELKDILDKHGKWLRSEDGGAKADLSCADLSCADLSSANLCYADLCYADLRDADLRSADLRYADLRSADLSSADLRYADLSSADFMVFQFQREWAYFTFDGALRIGCLLMPIPEWLIGYQEIGKANSYSDIQIEMYCDFIRQCAKLFEMQNQKNKS